MPRYVIYSIHEHEGTPSLLWWNKVLGWTSTARGATEFNEQERELMMLPNGNEVHWLKLLRPQHRDTEHKEKKE